MKDEARIIGLLDQFLRLPRCPLRGLLRCPVLGKVVNGKLIVPLNDSGKCIRLIVDSCDAFFICDLRFLLCIIISIGKRFEDSPLPIHLGRKKPVLRIIGVTCHDVIGCDHFP